MGLRKISTKICAQLHVFFAVETILSVWGDLESFDKKVWPVTRFFAVETIFFEGTWKVSTKRCAQLHVLFAVETILSFWWGLEKFPQKIVPSYTFFSLWRLTWVFDGTWKNFHKKVCPVTHFFAVQTILNFWWDLESFDKKVWPVTLFFAVETILSFWGDLESFEKKMCPVTRFFFAVEANLSFWWGLEKFPQKFVPSYTFFCCGDYLKCLRGLGKFRQKDLPSYTFFFAVETNLSFWRHLEKFSQKSVPSHMFLRCGAYLKFLMGLRKISTKICAQLHVFFSLWRQVFGGTWKNFHKKVCPVTRFFAVETILIFWWDLESFDKKVWPVTRFSLWRLS